MRGTSPLGGSVQWGSDMVGWSSAVGVDVDRASASASSKKPQELPSFSPTCLLPLVVPDSRSQSD